MKITADIAYLTTVLLVSIRLGAVFLLAPIFSIAKIPVTVMVIFVLSLSALLVANLNISSLATPESFGDLVSAGAFELVVGGAMAFGMFAAFAVFLFGGRILDFQMGFGIANLIDPVTHTPTPMLGTILNMMAVMMFLMINGHHMVIRGLVYSLEKVPPGSAINNFELSALVAQFGNLFVFGLAIVAPAVFSLLLLDVGMSFAARTMPQVNVFIVSIPLKIFVGLLMLALSLNYVAPLMERIFGSMFRYWERILG